MTDKDQKEIFSNNLNRILLERHKTQREVATSIGVSPQTFNTWCQGIALPRMGKIQLLADYFLLNKSDLIEEPAPAANPSSGALPRELSSDEAKLLNSYGMLNETGKTEALKRVDELAQIPMYRYTDHGSLDSDYMDKRLTA